MSPKYNLEEQGISNKQICELWPSTAVREVAEVIRPRSRFFTNTLFSRKEFQREEEVMWKRYYRKNAGPMPFSCPCDPAPMAINSAASETYNASFGHFALKTALQPCKPPRINPMEGIPWMEAPPEVRVALQLAEDLRFLEESRQQRIEDLIIEMLTTGHMTVPVFDQIEGIFLNKDDIDFKRLECLNGGEIDFPCDTDDCYFTTLNQLRDCSRQIAYSAPGARGNNIMFGIDACDHFLSQKKICEMAEKTRGANSPIFDVNLNLNPSTTIGNVEFMGTINQWNIWCNSEPKSCNTPEELKKKVGEVEMQFPRDGMLMFDSNALNGFQLYGPTYACNTMAPMERHIDMWEHKDPDECWTKMSMTMIPLPEQINATCYRTVKLPKKFDKPAEEKASSKKPA